MEDSVNLITLLGAAAGCKAFCELLFDNPTKAAQLLGFALTQSELVELQRTFTEENRKQLCKHFGELRTLLCKKRPCAFALVVPGHEDFCKESERSAA
jgi:hypothetical protein